MNTTIGARATSGEMTRGTRPFSVTMAVFIVRCQAVLAVMALLAGLGGGLDYPQSWSRPAATLAAGVWAVVAAAGADYHNRGRPSGTVMCALLGGLCLLDVLVDHPSRHPLALSASVVLLASLAWTVIHGRRGSEQRA